MSEYSGEKRSILANLAKKTQILHFELRTKDGIVSIEDGIAKVFLQGRNTIVVEFDQRDLGGVVSKLKALEVLSMYNARLSSKSFELQGNLAKLEIETVEDLAKGTNEVLIELRLTYRLK